MIDCKESVFYDFPEKGIDVFFFFPGRKLKFLSSTAWSLLYDVIFISK